MLDVTTTGALQITPSASPSPPRLHLHAPTPTGVLAGVVGTADFALQAIAPGGIGGKRAQHGPTEELVAKRNLRRGGQFAKGAAIAIAAGGKDF